MKFLNEIYQQCQYYQFFMWLTLSKNKLERLSHQNIFTIIKLYKMKIFVSYTILELWKQDVANNEMV